MIVQFVQFETSLGEDKALAVAREREPAYAATPGLLQKYYLRLGKPNHFGVNGGDKAGHSAAQIQAMGRAPSGMTRALSR